MPDEKQKILNIIQSLERDYQTSKISPQKYRYYMAKYKERLRYLDKNAATNRIRSMQGKPAPDIRRNRKRYDDARNKRKKEENGLVQKYIINPKKDDRDLNKKNKKSMDSGTYKLLAILILVIGLTLGIAVGIFAMDFEDLSVVHSDALVVDTSFPDISKVTIKDNETSTQSNDDVDSDDNSQNADHSGSSNNPSSGTTPGGSGEGGGQGSGEGGGQGSGSGGGQDSGTT